MARLVLPCLEALEFSLVAEPQSFCRAVPISFGSLLHDLGVVRQLPLAPDFFCFGQFSVFSAQID
jgi:hypothetical protein